MKKIIFLLTLVSVLFSCNSDEDAPTQSCLIKSYNKIIYNDNEAFYLNEFEYDSEYRIIRKITRNLSNMVIQTMDVEYQDNLPIKLIVDENLYYTMTYNHHQIDQMIKWRVLQSGYIEKYVYNFSFSNNKLIQIESYNLDDPDYENTLKTFYYTEGNVSKTIEIKTRDNYIENKTTLYSNFDNSTNPYNQISVPFLELLPNIYSENNHQKINYTQYINDEVGTISSSEFQLQYNSNGLPEYADYLCH